MAYLGARLLAACGGAGDLAGPGDSLVYAGRGARQCESDGLSPQASAQMLVNAGIDVLQSTCAVSTGVPIAAE